MFLTLNNFQIEGGLTKKIGYFSSSTSSPYSTNLDGLYMFSEAGKDIGIAIYKSGSVTESTYQSSWNLDTMDGNGISGINIDWSLNQIIVIDFEWLGVGRVRWGLVVNGLIVYFHESNHANNITGIYMSTPNQPLRWEVRQSGVSGGSMDYICGSVNSEGSINDIGLVLSDNCGTNDLQLNSSGTTYAAAGIRLKTTHLDAVIDILQYRYLSETNDRALWEVRLNPTVTGTFNYSDYTNSAVQTAFGNQTGGASPTAAGGTILSSGYVSSNTSFESAIDTAIKLGSKIDGTPDEIVLCITPIQNGLDAFVSQDFKQKS